jgi:hypothetical protein
MQYSIYGEFINNINYCSSINKTIEPFTEITCPNGQILFNGVCSKVRDPDVISDPELIGGLPLITTLKMNTNTDMLTSDPIKIEGPPPYTINFELESDMNNAEETKPANNGKGKGNSFRCYSVDHTFSGKCYKSCPSGWSFNDGKCYRCNGVFKDGTSYKKCIIGCPNGYEASIFDGKCYKKSCEPNTNIYSNLKCYTPTCEGNKVYDSITKKCYDCSNVKIDGVNTTYINNTCWKKCNVNENEDINDKRYCKTLNCPPGHIYDKGSSMCKMPICNNGIYDKTTGKCKTCQTGGIFYPVTIQCVYPPVY